MQQSPSLYITNKILPIECLYNIIDEFKHDRKQLYNILLVNKFFFNTTVRHLYRYHTLERSSYNYRLPKLLSVVFVSLLQTAVKESIDTPENNKSPSDIAREILGNFGLELALPYQPSGITLLHQIYGLHNYHDPIETKSNIFTTMTIDYSKLFAGLLQPHLEIVSLFRLKSSTTYDENKQEHSLVNPRKFIYNTHKDKFKPLELSVYLMWIHYNCATVTNLTLYIEVAKIFLPYASKLSNLETILLNRGDSLDESDFEVTLTFIRQNQQAFPKKRPLQILGWDTWRHSYSKLQINTNPMNYDSYTSAMRECRNTLTQYIKPNIAVFEAVKKPISMNLSYIPNFYNMTQNIDPDCLLYLCDLDDFRYEMGEIESMEKFLKRCSNLKTLEIAISHENAFSWATTERQTISGMPLMKLEELTIVYSVIHQFALMGLMDALSNFSSSLKKVTVHKKIHDVIVETPNYKKNFDTLRSIQLNSTPEANFIGDFPAPIPSLTHLSLRLGGVASVNFGSLDNCPNLEDLYIDLGRDWPDIVRPTGEEPTSIPLNNDLLDERWRNGQTDYTLFPIWHLPKLKNLTLKNLAAMKFDFATLPHLHRLETLTITTWYQDVGDEEPYFRRQNKSVSGSESISNHISGPQEGIFGPFSKKKWSLPYLHSIKIKGLPSQVLCLENLRCFPGLSYLSLDHFSSGNPRMYRFPLSDQLPNPECNHVIAKSRLETLEISGTFNISLDDLKSLFTIYAPFLKNFRTNSIRLYENLQQHDDYQTSESETYSILRAIKVTEDEKERIRNIESLGGVEVGKELSWRCLKLITLCGEITKNEQEKLDLKKVDYKKLDLYRKRGTSLIMFFTGDVFYRISDVFVHKDDYEEFENEN